MTLRATEYCFLRAAQRRRKGLQNFAAFRSLIQAPGSLTSGLALPASSRLGVSCSAVTAPGAKLVALSGEDLGVSGGPADLVMRLPYAERFKVVTLGPDAIAGTISLYVFDEWYRPYLIATG